MNRKIKILHQQKLFETNSRKKFECYRCCLSTNMYVILIEDGKIWKRIGVCNACKIPLSIFTKIWLQGNYVSFFRDIKQIKE